MDEIQPMVCCGDRDDAPGLAHAGETVAAFEVPHEGRDARARRRLVAADRHVMLGTRAPRPGLHEEVPAGAADPQHRLGCVVVEFAVQPADEFARGRLRQAALGRHAVDLRLHAHMGGRFELQVPTPLVVLQLARKRALDVPRPRFVSFDEIAVVSVHDAHESGKIGGRAGMQRLTKRRRSCRKLGHDVRDCLGRILQAGRLDALHAFEKPRVFGRSF